MNPAKRLQAGRNSDNNHFWLHDSAASAEMNSPISFPFKRQIWFSALHVCRALTSTDKDMANSFTDLEIKKTQSVSVRFHLSRRLLIFHIIIFYYYCSGSCQENTVGVFAQSGTFLLSVWCYSVNPMWWCTLKDFYNVIHVTFYKTKQLLGCKDWKIWIVYKL